MAIIKPGFSKGFRGRSQAASFGRRAHYLAAEHDRAGVVMLDRNDEGITPKAAIARMGGSEVEYHEIIVSPSHLECEAIRQYGSKVQSGQAMTETARRLSEAYAEGREYVTAIHGSEDGRFHFHITVQGAERPGTFGAQGRFQKVWNAHWIHQPHQHRVRDWNLHGRAQENQEKASAMARQQRLMAKERTEAIKAAPAELRMEVLERWREREARVAGERLTTETQAIEARYGCRGISDSILKQVELEKAQIRYQRALNELDRAEERIQANRLVQAYNLEAKGTAREYGKMFRAAQGDERDVIRAEFRSAQVALADRLHNVDVAKVNDRHQAAGSIGSLAHRADLERLGEVRSLRLQQAEARFEQEELRASLLETRKERDGAFRKATTQVERDQIQDTYAARRLDLWEASTAAKLRVVDLDYRIRGNPDSEAHIRALARVSEQEGKGLDAAIATERVRDELLNLRMELQALGVQRREVFTIAGGPEREATLARLNESETAVAQKVMAHELTLLRREFAGKADRVQWQMDREAILAKARETFQKSGPSSEERNGGSREPEEIHGADQEARLVLDHEEELAREDALHRGHEADANRSTVLYQPMGMVPRGGVGLDQAALGPKDDPTDLEERAWEEMPDAWPVAIKAGFQVRAEQILAKFQGFQERQELDPDIREQGAALEVLMNQTREALRVPGGDRAVIVQTFIDQAEPFRARMRTLQRDRLDSYFRSRAAGSGIGSEDHARAVRELESRSSLHAIGENLHLERAALHGQRTDDLKRLDRQAASDCLDREGEAVLREAIHARVENQERTLAHRWREEERRHHKETEVGQGRGQQETLADERLATTLERITLDGEIRAVRVALRDLRAECSEDLSREGAHRAALVQELEARLKPSLVEQQRLEVARVDTYHKGQPEERAIGSEAHRQAYEALEARQALAREREGLTLERAVLRYDRLDATRHLEDRAVREAVHQRFDEQERLLARRGAGIDRRQADLAYTHGSEEHAKAMGQAEARVQAIEERQAQDRQLRQVGDRAQDFRDGIRVELAQPGGDREKVLEESRPALQGLRQEAAQLHMERLDARFMGKGQGSTFEHQEARVRLLERMGHRAAMEDLGYQRAATLAEKHERLAAVWADQGLGESRRELLRKVPKIGPLLDLAARPSLEKQIADREAIHFAYKAKEQAHAEKAYGMELAHLERSFESGSKEHARAVNLAGAKLRAVGELQMVDKDLRLLRDQVSQVRNEARNAEHRPFADKMGIRAETQAKVEQVRGHIEELEHRRLAIQAAVREPMRMDSAEGRAHQREIQASTAHLVKDQELRRKIDDIRQGIAHARTDFQQTYKSNLLTRPVIQKEYRAQELQKVDQIHLLEVARIDGAHAGAGTTGGKGHQADLAAEAARHLEARQATGARDLGHKISAMEAWAHAKTVATIAVSGAAPDKIAKEVASRATHAALNAALDATLGEYAVVAKVARQVLTMGR